MKPLFKSSFLVLLLCLGLSTFSFAQEETDTYYHSLDYMKVQPGDHQNYQALEKVWKKIHEYNMKKGHISGWELAQVKSPSGESVEYNYVTRITLKSGDQFESFMESYPMPDDLGSLLNVKELELINKTNDLRTYVKNEIYSTIDMIISDGFQNAKIHVFNYFDHPEGKGRADHVSVEKDIWMPVHQLRTDSDKMEGWVLAGLMLPFGANQAYHEVTVDVYKDMSQYMSDDTFAPYFEKVHQGKDIDELMKQTRESSRLIKGEVRIILDKAITTPSTANLN